MFQLVWHFNFRKPKQHYYFFLHFLGNQTEELGNEVNGFMNCIFVDLVLRVKSACHRCLLLIYGRIIRLGHLINFPGAIISWWNMGHCGKWHIMQVRHAWCINLILLQLQHLLLGETLLVSELKYLLFMFSGKLIM